MNQNRPAFGMNNANINNGQNVWNGQNVPQPQALYNEYPRQQGYVPPQINFQQEYPPMGSGQFTGNGYNPQNVNPAGNGYYQPQQMPVQPAYMPDPAGQRYFRDSWTGNPYTGQTDTWSQGNETGSYIPQTPPNPMGMTGGYQPYNPNFGQMGRNDVPSAAQTQQQTGFRNGYTSGYTSPNQVPLNGGGYVPQAVPVRKQPFVFNDLMLLALSGILILLFVVGVFGKIEILKYGFAIVALASIVLFWMKPMIDSNKRLCFTVIFGVLLILAIIPFGTSAVRNEPTAAAQTVNNGNTATATTNGSTNTGTIPAAVQDTTGTQQAQPQETPTQAPSDDSATVSQLESFFYFWSVNKNEEMLSLCAPSWQSSVDAPATALFGIIANRTPIDYQLEKISGTADDTTRTITVTATIDRNNGKTPVKYRLNVLMQHENGNWYLNPNSLKTYDPIETATPDTSTPTPAPQVVNSSTVLYYNPDGGSMYHADPNCIRINERYLPLKGQFTYAQINDAQYVKLEPCNVCGAPLR